MARFTLLLAIISFAATAQTNCACCTEFHKQFDFWVGEWNVFDTAGNLVGENSIAKLENNCLVSEHWRGVKGVTGRSYNYFDLADSTWNQVWVDNTGTNLVLKGAAATNSMTLKSKLTKGTRIDWYYNVIKWTRNPDGSVTQLWQILDKDNKLVMIAFEGIYRRKK